MNRFQYARSVWHVVALGGFFICCGGPPAFAAPSCDPLAVGSLDPQFRPELDGAIRLMVGQSNGQVLVTGDFSHINGLVRKNLARLNANGSVDVTFAPIINGAIDTVAVQSDNRIVISGGFSEVNHIPKRFMARLNANGSLDTSFDAGTDWFSPGWGRPAIQQMVVQPDGKLLAAGAFTSVYGVTRPGLVRLNSNGTVDSGFNVTGIVGGIGTVAILPTGKILVGGYFNAFDLGLARLNADGSLDSSFQTIPNSSGAIYEIVPLADGKFLTGSPLISVGGVSRQGVARMLADGGVDPSFDPGTEITTDVFFRLGPVSPDGKVIVYNYFFPPAVRQFNADGTLNTNFVTTLQSGVSQVLLNGGSYWAGGAFSGAGEIAQPYLARIVTDPTQQQEQVEFVSTARSFEENAEQGELIVRRSGCATNAVSVDYALLPGTAMPGTDFVFNAGTVHWDAGDYSDKVISFQIVDDGRVDGLKSFAVLLSNPTGAVLGARSTAGVTLLDNEQPASQQDASYVQSAVATTGGFSAVYKMAGGPDGKVLIQGAFSSVGAAARPGFARLNADGSVDTQFNPQLSGSVSTFAIQPDLKSIIGGNFTRINGIARTNLARLNADGSLDSSFNAIPLPEMGAGAIVVQPDGRIVVVRSDGAWNQSFGSVLRLNADGSRDTSFQQFNLPDPAYVSGVALQSDGKILLAGAMDLVGGDVTPGVKRLNSDGSVDPTFNPQFNGLFYFISSLAVQPDGKIFVAGQSINLESAPIVRLNQDGSLDPGFRPEYLHGYYTGIQSIRVQPDGKVVVGGSFQSIGEVPRFNVARLNTDGSTDNSFDAGLLAGPDHFTIVYAVELQSDGKVLVTGGLNSELPGAGVIRLQPSNDTLNTFEFAADTFAANENTAQTTVVVVREGRSDISASVNLNVTGGTATPGQDYVAPAAVVTFAPLEVVRFISIPILDDALFEPTETIRLELSNPSSGLLGNLTSAVITIRDDEIPPSNLDTNFDLFPVFRALQSDDKLLATFNSGLMRYLPDGTQDDSFQFVFASGIRVVLQQPDGKILIGGTFSTVTAGTNMALRSGLARLNSNGTPDVAYNPGVDATGVSGLALQTDGKLLLAGVSSLVSTGFTRLLTNGNLDAAFRVMAPLGLSDAPIATVAVQGDGRILIGGNFYLINDTQRAGLARLNADGSLDPAFAPTVTGGLFTVAGVNSIHPLPDGKIWVGGVFTLVNGVAMSGITRLNGDGSLDTSLNLGGGVSGSVRVTLLQPDGRILIAGSFTAVAGTDRAGLARLNPDGSLDVGFAPTLPGGASIFTLGRQGDGAILLGGSFCDELPDDCDSESECPGTLRLKPDNALRFVNPTLAANGSLQIVAELFPGRNYALQSSTDLTHWTALATNKQAAASWSLSIPTTSAPNKFYRVLELH